MLLGLTLAVTAALAEHVAVQAHLHGKNAVMRRPVLADKHVFKNLLRRLLNNTLELGFIILSASSRTALYGVSKTRENKFPGIFNAAVKIYCGKQCFSRITYD